MENMLDGFDPGKWGESPAKDDIRSLDPVGKLGREHGEEEE